MPTYAAAGLAGPMCSLHMRAQGSRQPAVVSSLLITSCLQVYATDIDIERFGARSLLQSSPGSCNSGMLQAIAIWTGLHIVCHVWGSLKGHPEHVVICYYCHDLMLHCSALSARV